MGINGESLEDLHNFYYLVYQAYPSRDVVYYWVDGSLTRHSMKRPAFRKAMNRDPALMSMLHDSTDTTSFFLYDNVGAQIIQLTPKHKLDDFSFPLTHIYKVGYGTKAVNYNNMAPKKTLDDHLNELGFEPVNSDKIHNLSVALVKVKKDIVY